MNIQNSFSASNVGLVDCHVPVETTGPQQCRVEYFGAVCRGHYDYSGPWIETVHLNQELVQCLLPFIMTPDGIQPACLPQSVQLVHENDAWSVILGLAEKIADTRCPNANKHLDELRTAHAEERHSGLSRYGARKQSLASSGCPDKQNPFGNFASKLLEFSRVPQIFNDFLKFSPRLVYPGHIIECYANLFFGVNLHLRLANREHSLRS